MKALFGILAFAFVCSPAFAGKGFSAKHQDLGFIYSGGAMTEEIEICTADDAKDDACLTFKDAKPQPGDDQKQINRLREVHGKCELSVEFIEHSHGEEELHMFDIRYRVVKVTKGACTLPYLDKQSSVHGIYL